MTLYAKGLTALYAARTILDDVSLTLCTGEVVALAGANGAGKSTLLSALAGVASVSRPALSIKGGDVVCGGTAVRSMNSSERARLIAFMPQAEWSAWDYTAIDVVLMGRYASSGGRYGADDRAIALAALESAGALSCAMRSVRTLSGGEWTRVRLARAVCQGSPFMLLDEPCTGLDMGYAASVLRLLRALSREKPLGVLFSTHDINAAARYCDRMAFLSPNGALESGSVCEMMSAPRLSRLYGADVGVFPHPSRPAVPQAYIR